MKDRQRLLMPSPLGPLGLEASPVGVCRIVFDPERDFLLEGIGGTPWLEEAKKQLQAYFSGHLQRFDLPLDLNCATAFQKSVWLGLLQVPWGQTRTYQALAMEIGRPKACRAVGTACGQNPLPILIPCHRILASGGLGGFHGGLKRKIFLLTLEKQL